MASKIGAGSLNRDVHDVDDGNRLAMRTSARPGDPLLPQLLRSPDEVHVWTVPLDIAAWRDGLVPGWLSDEELLRAERTRFEQQRRRFAVCRATLRAILGSYLERPPCELRFGQGPYGKPHLDCGRSDPSIHFNVSHSDELALVAVSWERELGVDLERVRSIDGIDDIVARHFAPAERLAFSRVFPATRLSTFYRYWTLKEASLKACGVGLTRATAAIDVRLLPGQDPAAFVADLVRVVGDTAVTFRPQSQTWSATESSTETEMFRAITAVARARHPTALVTTIMLPGFTDSHYFRRMGIASYGLGPFPLTQSDSRGVHGNDERVSVEALRFGVRFYYDVVSRVAAK